MLTMFRGETPAWEITVNEVRGGVTTAYNLTGATIYCTAKRDLADADASAVFQLTVGSGITITNAAAGQAVIEPPASATNVLTEETQLWLDVRVIVGGKPHTVYGPTALLVRMPVTRAIV